jgi:hypothetical protein
MTSTLFFLTSTRRVCFDVLVGVRWMALSNLGTCRAFTSLARNKTSSWEKKHKSKWRFFFWIWGGKECFTNLSQPTVWSKEWWDDWWSANDLEESGLLLVVLTWCMSIMTIEKHGQNGHHLNKIRTHWYKYTVTWNISVIFGGPFTKLRKATINLVVSVFLFVCPSARTEQLCPYWKDFHKIWYPSIHIKSVEKIKVPSNLKRIIMSNLRENLRTLMITQKYFKQFQSLTMIT